jgi:hypothetical protein
MSGLPAQSSRRKTGKWSTFPIADSARSGRAAHVMADNAAALAAVAVGLLFLVLGGLVWVISRATGEGDAAAAKLKAEGGDPGVAAGGRRAPRARGGARRRRGRGVDDDEGDADDHHGAAEEDPREAARRAQQLAQAQEAELKHQKRAGKDAKYAAKEAEREEKERAAREAAESARVEKEKAEAAEFDKWKDMFTVEEEMAEESGGLLAEFVDYIAEKKVVVLEELAAEFGLRTQDAVSRVQALEQMGRITGVMDDRGKFIFISRDEMAEVAAFINRKGRVAIAELARKSSDFVKL